MSETSSTACVLKGSDCISQRDSRWQRDHMHSMTSMSLRSLTALCNRKVRILVDLDKQTFQSVDVVESNLMNGLLYP